jgi:hypothetical protein
MAINVGFIKEHPYEIAAVVIVGGIVVFYFAASGSSGSGATSSSGSSDTQAALAADAQIASVNAATQIQQSQTNAALQTAQINASVVNNETAASLQNANLGTYAQIISALSGNQTQLQITQSNNNAATTQLADQLVETQNTTQLQDQVLTDQLNQSANENANNNATSLASLVDQLNYGTGIAQLQTSLSAQQLQDNYNLTNTELAQKTAAQNFVFGNAGVSATSGEYGLEQTLLGNPGNGSPVAQNSSTAAALISSIGSIGNTVAKGLLG